MQTIIWDWNGTLLDDAWVGLAAMNAILARYGLPLLADMADYRRNFGFPVHAYYDRLGLGPDVFPVVSHEWVAEYNRLEVDCSLREGALAALQAAADAGYRQVVLSASKRESLLAQMRRYPVGQYFDEVLGLDHIYATSKEGIGMAWLRKSGQNAADCHLIGDTLHDGEVARAMGCPFTLITGGHQNADTLASMGREVLASPWAAVQAILTARRRAIT